MKRNLTSELRRGRLMLPLAIFIGISLLSSAVSATDAPIKIMPLGDSITRGFPIAGGYRHPLFIQLSDAGHEFTFVGTQDQNDTPLLSANSQERHEGHGGYVIELGTSGASGGIRENISVYLAANMPDLILLMIGTNDVIKNYQLGSAPARLGDLLSDINGLALDAHVIVASLTPADPSCGLDDRIAAYNAAIPGVVAAHKALGEKVSFFDMHSRLTASSDLGDCVHPNAAGYDKMATGWANGIDELLVVVPALQPWGSAILVLGLVTGALCLKEKREG